MRAHPKSPGTCALQTFSGGSSLARTNSHSETQGPGRLQKVPRHLAYITIRSWALPAANGNQPRPPAGLERLPRPFASAHQSAGRQLSTSETFFTHLSSCASRMKLRTTSHGHPLQNRTRVQWLNGRSLNQREGHKAGPTHPHSGTPSVLRRRKTSLIISRGRRCSALHGKR